ncbi:DUF962 domain-containing protein [Paucilactobacillus kaifaensis]|uniref:DUF962 domain-containing protein n=1 Tax=Paucilactobacillus kaifaensis TaxID=2559921 RepID=UPI0010F5CD5F|nr:DUF962 domain-containing protein [Paucilactobacillus kaifaensis]
MSKLDRNHVYSQHADKLTLFLFYFTSFLIIVVLVLAIILQNWWWLVVIPLIVIFWGFYSFIRPTVPVYDVTEQKLLSVRNKEWSQFKKECPNQVAKKGKT